MKTITAKDGQGIVINNPRFVIVVAAESLASLQITGDGVNVSGDHNTNSISQGGGDLQKTPGGRAE